MSDIDLSDAKIFIKEKTNQFKDCNRVNLNTHATVCRDIVPRASMSGVTPDNVHVDAIKCMFSHRTIASSKSAKFVSALCSNSAYARFHYCTFTRDALRDIVDAIIASGKKHRGPMAIAFEECDIYDDSSLMRDLRTRLFCKNMTTLLQGISGRPALVKITSKKMHFDFSIQRARDNFNTAVGGHGLAFVERQDCEPSCKYTDGLGDVVVDTCSMEIREKIVMKIMNAIFRRITIFPSGTIALGAIDYNEINGSRNAWDPDTLTCISTSSYNVYAIFRKLKEQNGSVRLRQCVHMDYLSKTMSLATALNMFTPQRFFVEEYLVLYPVKLYDDTEMVYKRHVRDEEAPSAKTARLFRI